MKVYVVTSALADGLGSFSVEGVFDDESYAIALKTELQTHPENDDVFINECVLNQFKKGET